MLVFFTMGFVDLVGIASNYVKLDLGLTDSEANIFPSLVFFWFLIFSVPTGMLMNKIGRKKTVMLSLVVTFVSLLIPCFGDGYMVMLVSFSISLIIFFSQGVIMIVLASGTVTVATFVKGTGAP
jgi:fucose permease